MKKYIGILGSGETGMGTAFLATQKGYEVFLSDAGVIPSEKKAQLLKWGIVFEEQKHTVEKLKKADCIVKSPGIPDDINIIQTLIKSDVKVISEIEFATRFTNANLIAITGSNGKTTTSSLTHHLLCDAGFSTGLAGNIGDSFAKMLIEKPSQNYVLEVSSFQLDGIENFAPHIAVITNITPDHLDRYQNDFSLYTASKMRITRNQTANDFLIYNADDSVIVQALQKIKPAAQLLPFSASKILETGGYIKDNFLTVKLSENTVEIPIDKLKIKGKHNLQNALVAMLVVVILGAEKTRLQKSLCNFQGVAHRMENIGIQGGVAYINDSKATNVAATYFALGAVSAPIIWIAGGQDKGNDYSELYDLVAQKVKLLICLSTDKKTIPTAFQGIVPQILCADDMKQAVKIARENAVSGDTVLLSPACASFDLFKNYEIRGNLFKKYVKNNE